MQSLYEKRDHQNREVCEFSLMGRERKRVALNATDEKFRTRMPAKKAKKHKKGDVEELNVATLRIIFVQKREMENRFETNTKMSSTSTHLISSLTLWRVPFNNAPYTAARGRTHQYLSFNSEVNYEPESYAIPSDRPLLKFGSL